MTVIAILAIYLGVAHGGCGSASECCETVNSLQGQVEALEDSLEDQRATRDSLSKALNKARFGHVPCLDLDSDDQPRAVANIQVLPGARYQISHAWSSSDSTSVADAATILNGANPAELSALEFQKFASRLQWSGKNRGGGLEECRYWVLMKKNDGVDPNEFIVRWMRKIAPYFGGAVNPSVFTR